MMTNHTGVHVLFDSIQKQYDKLKKKGAFLEQFKREPKFENGLEDMDESREVVNNLILEYKAAAKPDYIEWARAKFAGGDGPL